MAPNTVKPVGATHFLGFTTASDGRGANYVAVQITDVDELLVPGEFSFFFLSHIMTITYPIEAMLLNVSTSSVP